jgi:hypothetical protein
MMNRLCWLVVLLAVLRTASVSLAADLYHGRVVDQETGEPLAGAVVTVVWFRSPILGLEGTRDFQSAQETVADGDGKFSLVVSPGIDWNPLTYIRKEPEIVIFQPGYEPTWAGWMRRNKFATTLDLARELKKGTIIKLAKLKSHKEIMHFSSLGAVVDVVVPQRSIPNLVRAVNIQRKIAGLTSFYDEP